MPHPPIDHQITFLATRDLTATAHFYGEIMGLTEARDQGDCLIYRVNADAYIGFCQRADEPDEPKGVILTLVTPDVDGWFEYLTKQGVDYETPPQHNSRRNIYHSFLRDPNGYLIEIQRFLSPEEGHPVNIADYDPQWPAMFEAEKAHLLEIIGHVVTRIEHIGSTSVPGLGAKPIIDLMIAIPSLADAPQCIAPIESLGYEYVPEFEGSMPERRFFRKYDSSTRPAAPEAGFARAVGEDADGSSSIGSARPGVPAGAVDGNSGIGYHIHMVEPTGEFWERHLLFRDYLRAHPNVAQEYDKLKHKLAVEYTTDRHGYTSAKTTFIRQIERQARAWAGQTRTEGDAV